MIYHRAYTLLCCSSFAPAELWEASHGCWPRDGDDFPRCSLFFPVARECCQRCPYNGRTWSLTGWHHCDARIAAGLSLLKAAHYLVNCFQHQLHHHFALWWGAGRISHNDCACSLSAHGPDQQLVTSRATAQQGILCSYH